MINNAHNEETAHLGPTEIGFLEPMPILGRRKNIIFNIFADVLVYIFIILPECG